MKTLFSWDQNKNKSNQQKHGLSFEVAQAVFNDPRIISWLDNHSSEERWISLGSLSSNIIIVIHAEELSENDQEKTRIISARKANKKEEEKYYATINASKERT